MSLDTDLVSSPFLVLKPAAIQSVTWELAELRTGSQPEPRSGHTFTNVGNKNILFGGFGRKNGVASTFSDVWMLDIQSPDLLVWNESKTSSVTGGGEMPLPRSHHTAVAISANRLLIFGGINTRTRYDDVWILEIQGDKGVWIKPHVEGPTPPARSHHTCAFRNNVVYLFGGYGGHGKAYDDLWTLSLGDDDTPMTWTLAEPKGHGPSPRFNHTIAYFPNNLVISGGRDNSQTFRDMHLLDLETMTWQDAATNPSLAVGICNNVCSAIESVPNYKLFTFGGKKGIMDYINSVDVMDCGQLVWNTMNVMGKPPCPREDTAWIYDNKSCCLVVFGGWANRWMGDTWKLNISAIIGPPYACMRITPNDGPVFGDTELKISGLQFRQSPKIEVRFGSGKHEVTVPGTFVDQNTITCTTPNYEKFGAMEVDVRVSISGEGWTVNKVRFQYFANTAAKNCLAFGPGILSNGLFGVDMPFLIQSKDTCNSKRITGGDKFLVEVVNKDDAKVKGDVKIEDLMNGLYEVNYTVPRPGKYVVSICHDDLDEDTKSGNVELIHIRGSPFEVELENPWSYPTVEGDVPEKAPKTNLCPVANSFALMGEDDISILAPEGGNWTWKKSEVEGTAPAKRTDASIASIGNEIIIFGGKTEEGDTLNDVHVLKKTENVLKWSAITDVSAPSEPATPMAKPSTPPKEEPKPEAEDKPEAETEDKPEAEEAAAEDAAKEEDAGGEKEEGTAEEGAEEKEEAEAAEGEAKESTEGADESEPAKEAEPAAEEAEPQAAKEPEPEQEPEVPATPTPKELKTHDPSKPQPRMSAACCTLKSKNQFFIFGGVDDENVVSDHGFLEGFDKGNLKWSNPKVADAEWERRKGYLAACSGGKVYIFGGVSTNEETEEQTYHNDVFEVSIQAKDTWATTPIELKGEVPSARVGSLFSPFGLGKLILFGGTNQAGEKLYDAYIYEIKSSTFTRVFCADPGLLPKDGAILAIHGSKILTLAAGEEGKYDALSTLDPEDVRERYSFTSIMQKFTTNNLDELESWVAKMNAGLQLADNLEGVAQDFSKLLQVMGALFEIKSAKGTKELLLDQVKETLQVLGPSAMGSSKKKAQLAEIEELWETVLEAAPLVKASVQTIQDVEGERIKKDIADFAVKVKDFRKAFTDRNFFKFDNGWDASYSELDGAVNEIESLNEELYKFKRLADLFEFPEVIAPIAETIDNCQADLGVLRSVWTTTQKCETQFSEWRKTTWTEIKTDVMEMGTKGFIKEIKALPQRARAYDVYSGIERSAKNFLICIPLVADLSSPDMRDRHWQQLMEKTGVKLVIDANFKLDDLLALELHKYEDDVSEIVDRAQKEAKMEKSLSVLKETWKTVEYLFAQHKSTNVYTIKMSEETVETLEDNQVLVQGMMANRYMDTFRDEITGWNKTLASVADVSQIMMEIQRTWAYLEALFIHSDEVKKELPEAADQFKKIDQKIKEVLGTMNTTKNVVQCCTKIPLSDLEAEQKSLEFCEKALSDYMESKKRAFPRFYFVSTAELLDILSNSNEPANVQKHMSKCFQAIGSLKLDNDKPPPGTRPSGLGMISCVGSEEVEFKTPIKLDGKVEEYMNATVAKMRSELRGYLDDSIKAYPSKARTEWVFDWPSQLTLVVNQVFWTHEVDEAFANMAKDKDSLKKYSETQVKQLTDLIALTRTELPKPKRTKVMNMITIDAHSRDIVNNMVEAKVDKADDFLWASQLKTYWDKDINDCRVGVCDASFPYGYEYLGNGGRLVITPLTDRIYITATQACWLCLGTAPQGPAGTGKTETTKDLSAQLGKGIYVFNCSPEMDYRTMGDIFKGLAASGSWGCFDEFNRLIPEVLSVCSVQYKAVCDAQRKKAALPGRGLEYIDKEGTKHEAVKDYKFLAADGVEMPLEEGCSGYITMNPGYIGRAELPESLKVLFRPITVVVPDRQLIMENMLMAEGFTEADILAKKFASLYYLLEDLLSPQKHYDWGLRAIKSVLVVAGTLLRSVEGQAEADVLFRALRDFNVPKILDSDMPVFMGLLKDLFPGVDPPRAQDHAFEEVIKTVAEEKGLVCDDEFQLRVVQLSELMAIRHCIFLMGPSGVGRTECYRTLAHALERGCDTPSNTYLAVNNKKKVHISDLNPKAVSTTELYGYIELSTREWKDGILSNTMRDIANSQDDDPKWIILDGDLDANWIESMNSVMDDNRLLTLPSNERIRVEPHTKLVFEIRNLKFATPATATRAGILYISESTQWENMVASWVNRVMPAYAKAAKWADPSQPTTWVRDLFAKYVPATLEAIRKNFSYITPLPKMNLVSTLTNILEGLFTAENLSNKSEQVHFEQYFYFAMIWAFGGGLSTKDGIDYRKKFDKWFKQTWTTVKLPKGTIYDFAVDSKQQKFKQWDSASTVDFDSKTMNMASVFVPTVETSSLIFFMDMMLKARKPIMFVGPAGSGKTQVVKGRLGALNPEESLFQTINFNYFTDVITFQKTLESTLEKKAGINYAPPGTKKLVYFIDDMNMPKLDKYDTAMPLSLIRQHLGWGHWFDRTKLTYKNINNTQYVACMNPTAGSFIINPRLQRLFMTLAVEFPCQESLMKIFGTFLQSHLEKSGFGEECEQMGTKIIQAALTLHNKVCSTFRKTAVNFHYEFNVRHLTNLFQGLLLATPENYPTTSKLCKLWLHESERVYADRLVDAQHLQAYNKQAEAVAKKFLNIDDIGEYYKAKDAKPLLFSALGSGSGYDEIKSLQALNTTLVAALNEYNETNAVMDLVLFEDAMKHVCRIGRIILNPGGHALLVGVGGSGKQSLAKLAAHLCGYDVARIVISGNYGINNLKEDLQVMYKKAGLQDCGMMFLLQDSQITDERFMVLINDLLASGDIPGLFPQEDKDEIVNSIRMQVKAAGIVDTTDNCWEFFLDRIRANLHVVFTASPVGDDLRIRSQRFLALINCTVIDWFQPWPEQSLLDVAKKFMQDVEMVESEDDATSEKIRQGIVEFMPYSFALVGKTSQAYLAHEKQHVHTTPKSFLELIKLYKSLLAKKRQMSKEAIERLENGVNKIETTSSIVDVLVEEANAKAIEVEEKVVSSDAFAEKVGIEKVKANEENEAAQIEEEKCSIIAKEVMEKQASCEADLAAAEPLVAQAEAALDTLNKKDLGELKNLKKPPSGVDDVTAVVLILLQNNPKDKSWGAAQIMMKNVDKFIDQLKNFKPLIDEGKVAKKNVEACRPYIQLPHFNKEIMGNKSKAAAGLCEFVINIVMYYDVVSMVEPKRQELAEANAKLEGANTKLKAVREKVQALNEMVEDLENQFNKAIADKEAAILESERCKTKLALANRLINALAASAALWKETVGTMKVEYDVLVGDVLFFSAFCSYAGPFTSKYRAELINDWHQFIDSKGIPMTPGLTDPLKVMIDAATVASWVSEGLPSDPTSVQNGAILTNSERWSLMLDPQLQGIAWIKGREVKNDLQVTRLSNPKIVSTLEFAIENGQSVLIENIEETLDAVLTPVITRSFFKKGRSLYVKLGDKELEFNPNFRLFIHTKLSNPHYPPEIQAETTLINFTVTEKGLEDQLLALVVNKEKPELEETKAELIAQNNEYTIKLKDLESGLLQKLADAEGDITEDIELIESLEDTKRVSDEIKAKVEEAVSTEEKINTAREKYRDVASRGAMLFFILNSLNKIHSFYQFSLNAFVVVFIRGIDNSNIQPKSGFLRKMSFQAVVRKATKKFNWNGDLLRSLVPSAKNKQKKKAPTPELSPEQLAARLTKLIDTITFTVFEYTRRGLFDRDKLTVSTLLSLTILLKNGEITADENAMLCNSKKAGSVPPITDELSMWMSDSQWSVVEPLSKIPAFANFAKDMEKNSDEWKDWCSLDQPESVTMPGDWSHKLGDFQKLLIIKALKPERLTSALSKFVEKSMGKEYINQEPFDASKMMTETSQSTPVFFTLFSGYSPSKEIEAIADQYGNTLQNGKLTIISMGQGQEKPAEAILDKYMEEGGWVFLDNVHLMKGWLPTLERKLEVAAENGHMDFRCFLSAEPIAGNPHAKIVPESILQGCIKISNEPPSDMKSNLRRAFGAFNQELFDKFEEPKKQTAFKSILFGLCFYHSLLLGRKKFGVGIGTGTGSGLGFCRGYSFNMSDLTTCADVLYNYIVANQEVPWDDLRYMFGEVFYGGWITDAMDRRCCVTYLEVLFRPELLPDGNSSPNMELAPGFRAPYPTDYASLKNYIETALPTESPVMYGLHPNAEISLLTAEREILFGTISEISGDDGGSGGGSKGSDVVQRDLERFMQMLPDALDMIDIESRVKSKTPYVICALQEAARLNNLFAVMRKSMDELQLGLEGALNMSAEMEALSAGIASNSVPALWMSQVSTRIQEVYSLSAWYADILKREEQLKIWTKGDLSLPTSVWLPGLFNPKAFITAVMQTYARTNKLPLDVMKFMTDVTTKVDPSQIPEAPSEGAYVHGLCIEGARWDKASGSLRDSIPGELHTPMPVIWVKPVTADKFTLKSFYACPVYTNMQRANVYSPMVSTFTLRTKEAPHKWVLGSVALLLQDDLSA